MTTTCLYGGKVFNGQEMIDPGGIVFDIDGVRSVYAGGEARARRIVWSRPTVC